MVHGVTKTRTGLSDWTELNWNNILNAVHSPDFLGDSVVKTSPYNAGGACFIPGWGTRPCMLWGQNQNIKQKQYCNKFNKDFKNCSLQKIFLKQHVMCVSSIVKYISDFAHFNSNFVVLLLFILNLCSIVTFTSNLQIIFIFQILICFILISSV